MSKYALELLDRSHDRQSFTCGLETIDRYLKETARKHTESGVSLTRVLTESQAQAPKPVLGYFTLTPITVSASAWPDAPKHLPRQPVGAILLGRLGVASSHQNFGLSARLLALARRLSYDSLNAAGGIGLVVDASDKTLLPFYQKHGFCPTSPDHPLRLFLPTSSLVTQ